MKSWIEVSRRHLAENYRAAVEVVEHESSGMSVLAVIKANGYGHGAAVCAPVLTAAGAPWFGVTDAEEGATVRAALAQTGVPLGNQPGILVMCGHLPEDAPQIVRHQLTAVVWRLEQLDGLARVAAAEPVPVHLEIDSGMSRQGVPVGEELRKMLRLLAAEPRLALDGVLTHFASAEVAGSVQTMAQQQRFEAAVGMVEASGLRPAWVHAGNTSTIDNRAGTLAWLGSQAARLRAKAMVREGLGLYGHCLPLQGLVAGDEAPRLRSRLRSVMAWKTRIISVMDLDPHAHIGYNGSFVAPHAMRVALLPVGYADGLRRELSSTNLQAGGWVIIRGSRVPILGRVSMNLTTVDISGIPDAGVGDEALLLGEGITADDHAALAGTLAYEILCGIRAPIIAV